MMSKTESTTIRVGIFAAVDRAETAIDSLIAAGIERDAISVICSDDSKVIRLEQTNGDQVDSLERDDTTITSGVAGGVIGGLAALAGVALTGGIGILAVGPIVAGGLTGTLLGVLVGKGVEEETARFYEQAVTDGNVLVAVHLDDESRAKATRVDEVLRESGSAPVTLKPMN